MISLKRLSIFAFASCCSCTAAMAQNSIGPSAIDAAGGSAIAGGNTYEYAIGQVVASNTFSSSSLVITPGVLQPNISNTNGVSNPAIKAAELQVFPSPAEHTVFIQPAFHTSGTLQWSLYDATGRLVLSKSTQLTGGIERQALDVSSFSAGQYMLQVSWRDAVGLQTSSYKIQKIK